MFDLEFVNRYRDLEITPSLPRFYWLNGPPGCGKTYMIVQNFNLHTIVLTATCAGATDVVRALVHKGYDEDEAEKGVKTAAAAMMNPKYLKGFSRILVDEATMVHPGQIVFLAATTALVTTVVDSE